MFKFLGCPVSVCAPVPERSRMIHC